ncbi:MAG: endonuclease III [Nitrospirales bacterium]|nr:endonuclease III [Nitrospirales bacterium]
MRDSDIHAMVRLIQKEITQWKEPIVGVVANQSRDPFQVLIACLLSLRTQDHTTAQACQRLFSLATDPTSMGQLSLPQLERAIYPVGFYRTKAKQIRLICQKLIAEYNTDVPCDLEDLLTLPGVGRKTANLVVTIGYGKPGICVDIHVHRISNRWGYVKTRNPDETEKVLRAKLPPRYWIRFNDWLVPFGQNLCRPLSPHCSQCPVSEYCSRIGVTSSR